MDNETIRVLLDRPRRENGGWASRGVVLPATTEHRLSQFEMTEPRGLYRERNGWGNEMPTVDHGKFEVYWVLAHTIKLAPGKVGLPIRLATLSVCLRALDVSVSSERARRRVVHRKVPTLARSDRAALIRDYSPNPTRRRGSCIPSELDGLRFAGISHKIQ